MYWSNRATFVLWVKLFQDLYNFDLFSPYYADNRQLLILQSLLKSQSLDLD